tara:strand:- start:96 stop:362 length:267 start_codon:yes stop_codon:yes gene_type:complete
MTYELNLNDNTVDLYVYGVIYSSSVENFNKKQSYVKSTYWLDGLQQIEEDKSINILDKDSEFSLEEVVQCFEKIPHNELEITIEENEN